MDFKVPDYMQELALASGQGLDQLSAVLARILDHPVLISSSAYKLFSSSSHYDFESFHIYSNQPRTGSDALFTCHILTDTMQSLALGRVVAPFGRTLAIFLCLLMTTLQTQLTLNPSWIMQHPSVPSISRTASSLNKNKASSKMPFSMI